MHLRVGGTVYTGHCQVDPCSFWVSFSEVAFETTVLLLTPPQERTSRLEDTFEGSVGMRMLVRVSSV